MSEHFNYRLYPILGKPDGFASGIPITVYAYGYDTINQSVICKPLDAIINDKGDYRVCVPVKQRSADGHTYGQNTYAYIDKNSMNKFENLEFAYGACRNKYYAKDGYFKAINGKYVSIYTTNEKVDEYYKKHVKNKIQ